MSHPKILLIEDNGSDAFLLHRALLICDPDAEVAILTNGEAAITYVREQHSVEDHEHPCVIVLDLGLPRYDGIEVLETIRSESPLRHVHVVVVAGIATPREEEKILELGAHFRRKPSDLPNFEWLAQEIIDLCRNNFQVARV